jgi:hypothetical protein
MNRQGNTNGQDTGVYSLEVDAWGRFFDSIGVAGSAPLVTVTLVRSRGGKEEGAREPEGRPLRAIRYESERNLLQIAVGGTAREPELRYFITEPRRIVVEDSGDERTIVVDDASRARTAISMRGLADRRGASAELLPLAR